MQHSAADAPEMLYQALKVFPSDVKKYFRADSAYSSSEIYNVCLNQNCNFVTVDASRLKRGKFPGFKT